MTWEERVKAWLVRLYEIEPQDYQEDQCTCHPDEPDCDWCSTVREAFRL